MSDLIEKKDVVELLNNSYVQEDGRHNWRDHNNDCIDRLIEKVKAIPSARPKEGRWIRTFDGNEWFWYCSNCKTQYYEEDLWMGGNEFPYYCPNCGADMREREGE